jgi:hypothetical protein
MWYVACCHHLAIPRYFHASVDICACLCLHVCAQRHTHPVARIPPADSHAGSATCPARARPRAPPWRARRRRTSSRRRARTCRAPGLPRPVLTLTSRVLASPASDVGEKIHLRLLTLRCSLWLNLPESKSQDPTMLVWGLGVTAWCGYPCGETASLLTRLRGLH